MHAISPASYQEEQVAVGGLHIEDGDLGCGPRLLGDLEEFSLAVALHVQRDDARHACATGEVHDSVNHLPIAQSRRQCSGGRVLPSFPGDEKSLASSESAPGLVAFLSGSPALAPTHTPGESSRHKFDTLVHWLRE